MNLKLVFCLEILRFLELCKTKEDYILFLQCKGRPVNNKQIFLVFLYFYGGMVDLTRFIDECLCGMVDDFVDHFKRRIGLDIVEEFAMWVDH